MHAFDDEVGREDDGDTADRHHRCVVADPGLTGWHGNAGGRLEAGAEPLDQGELVERSPVRDAGFAGIGSVHAVLPTTD